MTGGKSSRPILKTPEGIKKLLLHSCCAPCSAEIMERLIADLVTNPFFSTRDFKAVPQKYRTLVPEYVKDYVALN